VQIDANCAAHTAKADLHFLVTSLKVVLIIRTKHSSSLSLVFGPVMICFTVIMKVITSSPGQLLLAKLDGEIWPLKYGRVTQDWGCD
jgi:hypothetical protein